MMANLLANALRDTSRNTADAMGQAVQAALRDNKRYEKIHMETVDPFNPCPTAADRKGSEKYETDVNRFILSLVPTLRNRDVPDSVRKRTLFHHTRGTAREWLRQFNIEGEPPGLQNEIPTFEYIVNALQAHFNDERPPEQLMKILKRVTRRPGEDILTYYGWMMKLAQPVFAADATMELPCLAEIYDKIMDECDGELVADMYDQHSMHNIEAALQYIKKWVARRPSSRLHPTNLAKERKEAEKRKNDGGSNTSNHSGQNRGSNGSQRPQNRSAPRVNATRALPGPDGWQEGDTGQGTEEEGAETHVIRCHNCDEPGHYVRDCPDMSQTQTVVPKRKNGGAGGAKGSGSSGKAPLGKSSNNRKKCRVCLKTNHKEADCFLLKKVIKIWKELKGNAATNFMQLAMSDPFHEEVMPIREVIAQNVDWHELDISEGEATGAITAALCYLSLNEEDEDLED